MFLAGVSLAWQVYSWVASGSKVIVETDRGFLAPGDGSTRDYVGVTVRNISRTPVDVTGWAFSLPDGTQLVIVEPEPWDGPPLPVRLEAGQAESWRRSAEKMVNSLRIEGLAPDTLLKGRVNLATGATVLAKKGRRLS